MPFALSAAPAELDERIALQHLALNQQSVMTGFAVFNQRQSLTHLLQVLIVTVHECSTVMFAQPVIEFTLGAFYPLKRTESQKMGLTHIGDKTKVGLAYLYQFLYVTGMTCTHLNDGILMLRFKPKHCKRNAYGVVQVTLSTQNVVRCAHDGIGKFLCGGFSVCAGNAYNGSTQSTSVQRSNLLKS